MPSIVGILTFISRKNSCLSKLSMNIFITSGPDSKALSSHTILADFPVWEIAVHLAVACDVYDGVFLCCPFSHEMSWMRS